MRKYQTISLFFGMLWLLFAGCDTLSTKEKYQRPDWLPGKLYTSVSVQKNLSLFAECLRLTGLDTIINVSGCWTVFAPTDEAIRAYLLENNYARLADIPIMKLERMTKFHIIQDPWSLNQLKILGSTGWRTYDNSKSESYAYKRETMLRNPNDKYWIKKEYRKQWVVTDSAIADSYKMGYTSSRKFVPIFYDKYLSVNGLSSVDYKFYFNREFEPGNVYYAGAKILQADIFADNGFVHVIDKVVEPLLNAKERLEREVPGESYRLFLEMVYQYYPAFSPNMVATNNQPEIKLGGIADTLWDINYAALAFNLQKERFETINQTLIRHNGLIAPTDEAFKKFIDGVLTVKSGFPHWNNTKSLPMDIVNIIVAQNVKSSPIYPSRSTYKKIFKESNRYHQNQEDIIRTDFGSNSTFIGLGNYTPDRAFTSVTGPVFCRPNFSFFRLALQYSGALDVIATHKGPLLFFPITDFSMIADSSLLVEWIDKDKNTYNFKTYNRQKRRMESVNASDLSRWLLNQVGTSTNPGASKEIIQTLGGNTLTWDHSNNTIRGTLPSTFGYKGTQVVTCSPFPLDEPTDNGKSLTVQSWFNF